MCENYSSCSSQPLLHNLSLMNLDFVILEYGHDVSSYMVVKLKSTHSINQG